MAESPKKANGAVQKTDRRRKAARRRQTRRLLTTLVVLAAGIAAFCWALHYLQQTASNPASGLDVPLAENTTSSGKAATTGEPTKTDAETSAVSTASQTAATTSSGKAGDHYVQQGNPAWNLILVNDWNEVPSSYESMSNMVQIGSQKLDSRIEDAVRRLLSAGAAYDLRVVSGYRPTAQQATLYNREVTKWQNQGYSLEKARVIAATIVKPPGHSEHNTGLAMDVGGSGNYSLEEDFEQTAAFRWLQEHCAEYGFILRFPKNKEDVTGVIYEPWHYRYVGVDYAKEIMSRGITLEEFLAEKGR